MKNQIHGLKISNEEINKITRESIQEALIYFLGKKEMDDISVTEIVEKAGVSRSAYYRNYQNKEEILKDFSTNVFDLVFSSLENEEYFLDPRQWLIYVFTQIKSNSRLIKLIVKAKSIPFVQFFPKYDEETFTEEEVYQITALQIGIGSIIKRWVERNYDLPVIELAEMCLKTFTNMELLFRKKKQ